MPRPGSQVVRVANADLRVRAFGLPGGRIVGAQQSNVPSSDALREYDYVAHVLRKQRAVPGDLGEVLGRSESHLDAVLHLRVVRAVGDRIRARDDVDPGIFDAPGFHRHDLTGFGVGAKSCRSVAFKLKRSKASEIQPIEEEDMRCLKVHDLICRVSPTSWNKSPPSVTRIESSTDVGSSGVAS